MMPVASGRILNPLFRHLGKLKLAQSVLDSMKYGINLTKSLSSLAIVDIFAHGDYRWMNEFQSREQQGKKPAIHEP
jgi:hypothetical protein